MSLITPIPLEPAWRDVLEHSAGRAVDARALGIMVGRLSRRYLGEADVVLAHADELLARVLFWFPRDVQKVALPVAELAMSGAMPRGALRVLDLGAGMGAACLGLERALGHPALRAAVPAGLPAIGHIDAVDTDRSALEMLQRIASRARDRGVLAAKGPEIVTHRADVRTVAEKRGAAPYDLVLMANALVELTRDAGDEVVRGSAMATHIAAIIEGAPLAANGAMIVVEPATRPETRALHHARAALIAQGYAIFAPCTHQGECPMLQRERDWCHEDLAADLPEWLSPVAREAGLRWEGLTFSYLVVRRHATQSVGEVGLVGGMDGWVPARLVSQPRTTKGKTDVLACGALAPGHTGARWMQLDRHVHKRESGGVLSERARGDVVAVRSLVTAAMRPGGVTRVAPGDLRPGAVLRGPTGPP